MCCLSDRLLPLLDADLFLQSDQSPQTDPTATDYTSLCRRGATECPVPVTFRSYSSCRFRKEHTHNEIQGHTLLLTFTFTFTFTRCTGLKQESRHTVCLRPHSLGTIPHSSNLAPAHHDADHQTPEHHARPRTSSSINSRPASP